LIKRKVLLVACAIVFVLPVLLEPVQADPLTWVKYSQYPSSPFWLYDSIAHWKYQVAGPYNAWLYFKDETSFAYPWGLKQWDINTDQIGSRGYASYVDQKISAFIKGQKTKGYWTNGDGLYWIIRVKNDAPKTYDFWLYLFLNGAPAGSPLLTLSNRQGDYHWYVDIEMYYYNWYTVKIDWEVYHGSGYWYGSTTIGYIVYPDLFFKLDLPQPNNFQGIQEGWSWHSITKNYYP
jgi:hypothetical protein